MNTITENKVAHTYNEFIQKNSLELFKEIVIGFKIKAKKEGLSSYEHLLYNLIRGLVPTRGFSTVKIEKTEGYNLVLRDLKYNLKYNANKGYLEKMSPETIQKFLSILEA